ncbi:MAG: hypothetical protein KJ950_08325 [Proteobacteria bacterium]|nr:hypothetical protein [Pseudomonadota bacterium]MBU1686497.1 hypothetical protein [Pseudomonadota bacterium]
MISFRLLTIIALVILGCHSPLPAQAEQAFWKFPELPPPHQYGDILIDRLSSSKGMKPVWFSHWSHRLKYSCRVCHLELEFSFKKNTTLMTEEENRNGQYCGTCHDGEKVFGHDEKNCARCHTGEIQSDPKRFADLTHDLQKSPFGNKINWAGAMRSGRINPIYSLFNPEETPMPFKKNLELEAEWPFVPPALFPHKIHVQWLDCANCHPDPFNIKKKTTEHFLMQYILENQFCGVCHLKVAFPLNDCTRCHPGITMEK